MMSKAEAMTTDRSKSRGNRWILLAALILLLTGLAIRLYDLTDAPLDFHPVRQLRSAMIARGLYFENLEGVPDWQREMAVRQANGLEALEPQILETMVAFTYRIVGQEILWAARVYSVVFWLAGGIGLFLLARRLAGAGALFTLAYFLFLPFGVQASRSFQPDPLMVMLTIFAVLALDHWFSAKQPGWRLTLLTGVLGGLAVLVKIPAAFFLAGAFLGLTLAENRLPSVLRDGKAWVIVLLFMLPAGVYYGNWMVFEGVGGGESWRFFVGSLLTSPRFYLDWLAFVERIVGYAALAGALIGLVLFDQRGRALLLGLFCSYAAYGLTFTYHIATHNYYSLPLVAIIALGLAAPGKVLLENIGQRVRTAPALQALAAGIGLFALLLPLRTARGILAGIDYRPEVGYWQALGEVLEHRSDLMEISHDYGYRLEYYGWVDGAAWPTTEDLHLLEILGQNGGEASLEVVAQQLEGRSLFVVTILSDLDRLPTLKSYLEQRPVFASGDDYIIYDLRPIEDS